MDLTSDSRDALIDAFLTAAGWSGATRHWLGQDASTRRYARLTAPGGGSAILMDAPQIEPPPCPPGADEATRLAMGWNASTRLAASRVDAFALIAVHLREMGLHTPGIYAHDSENGFALLEDFGEGREFARLIERGEADETELYTTAAEVLAFLHSKPAPDAVTLNDETWPILDFDAVALRANADLFADWLHKHDGRARMTDADRARWETVRDGLIEQAMTFPRVLTLRDFHAENLLWLQHYKGRSRVGLLDFQDAVRGWDAWDLAMLTQDARREVSAEAREAAISHYLDLTGKTREGLDERLAVIGTLNALRITGVFARLITRDGKPRYGDFMPRQQRLLAQNLAHPAAADMRAFVSEVAPFILEMRA